MEKKYLVDITNNLYQMTLLFPKKEPLRYKMREVAGNILAGVIELKQLSNPGHSSKSIISEKYNKLFGDLEILDGFFEVAKNQDWVLLQNLLQIQQNYNKIGDEIKKMQNELPKESLPEKKTFQMEVVKPESQSLVSMDKVGQALNDQPSSMKMSERKEKILNFLKENGKVQVWQAKQIFSEVTKRTLRRDFEDLLKKGLIERIGERNNTFYQIKKD